MLALEQHPVCCLLYLHRRMAGQQIDHHARMRRIKMLDQNERHASAGRERGEQPPGSIKAAGRGAEPDDREAVSLERRAKPRRRTPGRPRASRSGLSRSLFYHMLILPQSFASRPHWLPDSALVRTVDVSTTLLLLSSPRSSGHASSIIWRRRSRRFE
jgi:hypothetical protein